MEADHRAPRLYVDDDLPNAAVALDEPRSACCRAQRGEAADHDQGGAGSSGRRRVALIETEDVARQVAAR